MTTLVLDLLAHARYRAAARRWETAVARYTATGSLLDRQWRDLAARDKELAGLAWMAVSP